MSKILNLFGAPGSGKSTIASGLFYKMKCDNKSVELVTEFAKDLIYSSRSKCLDNQLYVSATQEYRIDRVYGQVDWVITDAPILQGLAYVDAYYKNYPKLMFEIFHSRNNVNFLLKRVFKYSSLGREQTEDESNEIHGKLKRILYDNKIKYLELDGDGEALERIFENVKGIK